MSINDNPFGLNADDLTFAFIDGPNLYATFKALDNEHNVDYSALRDLFKDNCRLQGIVYYTATRPVGDGEDDHSPIIPLIDYLANNGYRVYRKIARSIATDVGTRIKGSVNMEIGLDAFEMASKGMDHIVLFISDGDMAPVIQRIHRSGGRVTVVSTRHDRIVSDELRREADAFVDLADIMPLIRRKSPTSNWQRKPSQRESSSRDHSPRDGRETLGLRAQ